MAVAVAAAGCSPQPVVDAGCVEGTQMACLLGPPSGRDLCRFGAQVCVRGRFSSCTAAGNAPDETRCPMHFGEHLCRGGLCETCTNVEPCDPGPCGSLGRLCRTDWPVCRALAFVDKGTVCDGGWCDGRGSCAPCREGNPCDAGECRVGIVSYCLASAMTCRDQGAVAHGTACSGGTCFDGGCQ